MSNIILNWPANIATTQLNEEYGSAVLDVTVLTGSPTINLLGSIDKVNFKALDVQALSPTATRSTIITSGMYSVPLAGEIKYTIAGGTAIVNLMFKR